MALLFAIAVLMAAIIIAGVISVFTG